jgi:hypothetical protein
MRRGPRERLDRPADEPLEMANNEMNENAVQQVNKYRNARARGAPQPSILIWVVQVGPILVIWTAMILLKG